MRPLLLPWLFAAVVGVATAQDEERARVDLARTQQALQQNRQEVERLTEQRMRHDMGLPYETGDSFKNETPATTQSIEQLQLLLRSEDAKTADLLSRFNKQKAEVERLQAEAAALVARNREDEEWVAVPQPGSRATPPGRPARSEQPIPFVEGNSIPPAPAGETAPVPDVRMVSNLDAVKAKIHGSTDHSRVAQALYRAGLSRLDLAVALAAQGQHAAAADLDAKGKELLLRALDELAPQLTGKTPAFVDLFYQGKCRELLFRIAQRRENLNLRDAAAEYQRREQEVREPFLQIAARDVVSKGERGGTEVLGPWGRAAQTAMEHFRWMNEHSGFRPRTPIEAIQWEGERKR